MKIVYAFLFLLSCNPEKQQFDGLVRVIGHEPFTQLAITSQSKDFIFSRVDKKTYAHLQGKYVRFYGVVDVIDVELADHKTILKEYRIKPDSIIVLHEQGLFHNE